MSWPKKLSDLGMTDAEKLRALALLFDELDNRRGYLGERNVQDDLRRIADDLESREGKTK